MQALSFTLKETGCLQYDLHQDNNNPEICIFYEYWASHELWQAHMNSQHIQAYQDVTQGMAALFTPHEMSTLLV